MMCAADYTVSNHGSLFLLQAETPTALENLLDNTNDETQWLGKAIAVEPRYIGPLVDQLREEGWIIE